MSTATTEGAEVVVTGCGVVSPIGVGVADFWAAIQAGRDAAARVISFDVTGMRNQVGCEIPGALLEGRDGAAGRGLPRASRLARIAAEEALASSRLGADEVDGLCVGTTMGDLPAVESQLGLGGADDGAVAESLRSSLGGRIAKSLGVRGTTLTVATSCSAGNVAICRAADLIAGAHATRLLAGGADAFSRLAFIGFSRMRAMARERCTPFAAGREGMLLGEGAGFVVLESRRSAERRGAPIHAVVAGYGLSCDARHLATPDGTGRGAAAAMCMALRSARLDPAEIDYVSAHGTGTPANDLAEAKACAAVFDGRQPFISSLKALVGHSLGAASALEAIACVVSLGEQRLIPAWNCDRPDPACAVRLPIDGSACLDQPVRAVLSNAFAFGGNNSCLALRHPAQDH
jgi:3-oxoacyl-[acyl-carrier-protein] synthase II